MLFNKLNLDQQNIAPLLIKYPNCKSIITKEVGDMKEYAITINNKVALLNVLSEKDGTISLFFNIGKEKDLSKNIAIYLKRWSN